MGPGLIVAAIAVAVFAWKSHQTKGLNAAWGELAARHGLTLRPASWLDGPRLDGVVDGFGLTCDTFETGGKNKTTWTRVTVHPGVPLPADALIELEGTLSGLAKMVGYQDIQIGNDYMDRALMIRGRNEDDVRGWLLEPAAEVLPHALEGPRDCVREGEITVVVRGRDALALPRLMERAVGLARSLEQARLRVWRELEARPGLESAWDGDILVVRGEVDGVALVIHADPRHGRYRIQADHGLDLPEGFSITKGQSKLGDPILDRMVRLRGMEGEQVARLFDDALREDVLAVVHGQPGSTVGPGGILLEGRAFSDPELPTRVEDVVRLVRSLQRRWAALHGGVVPPRGVETAR